MFQTLYTSLLIIAILFLFGVIFLVFYFLSEGIRGVPWVRTDHKLSKEMLRIAQVQPGDHVVDFGSGDGSIVITAVRDFGAIGYGIERMRLLVSYSKFLARHHGVKDRTYFICGDMFTTPPPKNADVIVSYLFHEVNCKLEPILLKHYPSGTRVVSRTFSFPNLNHIRSESVGKETIYLYELS